jgi:hypothetical protein
MADLQSRLAHLAELNAAGRLPGGEYTAAVQDEINRALSGPLSGAEVAAAARALRALVAAGLLHQAEARLTAEKLLAKSRAERLEDAGPARPAGAGTAAFTVEDQLEVSIDIETAIKTAWKVVRKRFWRFLLLFLVTLGVGFAAGFVGHFVERQGWHLAGVALNVADLLVNSLMMAGLARLALTLSLDPEAEFGPSILFREGPLLGRYLLVTLLMWLATVGGFLLLIIPGIVFFLRYSMAILAALDGHTAGRAMGYSSRLTYGHKKRLFIFFVALLCLNILGLLALGIGVLVTYPMTIVATGIVYRQLHGRA